MKRSGVYRLVFSLGLIGLVSILGFMMAKKGVAQAPGYPGEQDVFQSGVIWEPFTEDLPNPIDNVKQPVEPFNFQCSLPQFEGQLPPKFYEVRIRKGTAEIVPGFQTEIWGYDGTYPGPTFRARHNEPSIVRFHNELDVLTVVHLHGIHVVSESDGNPALPESRLIHPGEFKDFCYPNIAPIGPNGVQDRSDIPIFLWYHDHAHEHGSPVGITGRNVYHGLAGFYITTDALEQDLIRRRVLPANEFDIPLAIQDRALDTGGQLIYRPEAVDYDGVLGDIPVVNGKAQPKLNVERRKYRFRILNGSTARFIQLRLSSGEFMQIGADSWLLGEAVTPTASTDEGTRVGEIRLGNAERADVIIDFRNAPSEVFLENILFQENGREPDEIVDPGTPLLKFIVADEPAPLEEDATIKVGDELRPHTPIREDEIVRTRIFEFVRHNGRWAVNNQFFDHERADANPTIGTAERWILKSGGGWAHPIHIHDEAHQIQSFKRRLVDVQERFNKDTVRLEDGDEVELFIRFRTFPGRFVFHCHNNEHEDNAMMLRYDVVEEEGLREAQTFDRAQFAPGQPPLPNVSGDAALNAGGASTEKDAGTSAGSPTTGAGDTLSGTPSISTEPPGIPAPQR
jgi:FtsP/CotA-like multicopper oxidase with cupredoxin domain